LDVGGFYCSFFFPSFVLGFRIKKIKKQEIGMKMKNYWILLMMVFVGGLGLSSCSNDDDYVYYPRSAVQFVNAYPYQEALGFKMDGQVVN